MHIMNAHKLWGGGGNKTDFDSNQNPQNHEDDSKYCDVCESYDIRT